MSIEQAQEIFLRFGAEAGEQLARMAMDWALTLFAQTPNASHAELVDAFPTVVMYAPAALMRDPNEPDCFRMGTIKDEFAAEHLLVDLEAEEFHVSRE